MQEYAEKGALYVWCCVSIRHVHSRTFFLSSHVSDTGGLGKCSHV